MTQIAIIALVPGQAGFYDDLSSIHLSLEKREAKVYPGTNITGLINAVKAGKITVVSGSLGSETLTYKEATKAMSHYYRLLEMKKRKQLKEQIISITTISEPINKPIMEEKIEPKIEVEITVEEVEETADAKKKAKKKKEDVKED